MNLYGLTLTEATVATIMSEGHTSEEVAQEMNIKKNTVRAHIRSLFAKLGVSRQSMLVSVVLNSLATT
nr:helix-turn-helix transcriptional regulator [Pseudomaricurvus alkylphenolicus]